MTYFADMTPCTYFPGVGSNLIAVGWLDEHHDYERGHVSRELFSKLVELLVDPWQPAACAGRHACPFCRFTGGPVALVLRASSAALGSANLLVPFDEGVLVAPSLVVHFIDAHGYQPPDAFLRAVQACPPMRSMEYLRALAKQGVKVMA